jgi:2-polyprenyl-3-methyl-5-hydroxy-6-metoxy-1,4-benzoquinol methylase
MHKEYEKKYHQIEENHWWFRARRELIFKLLKRTNAKKIIDIGCSSGQMLKILKETGLEVKGIDISQKAVNICKNSDLNVILAKGEETGLSEKFDVLIASDVLEHIENETSAIKEWERILKKGGKAIVFVPAFNFLWKPHDETNHHLRRYSLRKLENLFQKNGFTIEQSGYWNFFMFPLIAFLKILQKKTLKGKDNLK